MEWALIFLATVTLGTTEAEAPVAVEAPVAYQRTESTQEALGVLSECWGVDDWRECPAVKAREL
jgi:hypothetical protein